MSINLSNEAKNAMISITCLILVAGASAVILTVTRQNQYPPFKAKQLPAITVSLVAACFWMFGAMQTLEIFDLTSPVWSNCAIWAIWY